MKHFDHSEGMKLRDAGKMLASSKRAYILSYARVLAVTIAKSKPDRCVTADDVYRQLALLGHDLDLLGNAAGSLFRGDRWEFTGERKKSVRISNHARWIMVWRMKIGLETSEHQDGMKTESVRGDQEYRGAMKRLLDS